MSFNLCLPLQVDIDMTCLNLLKKDFQFLKSEEIACGNKSIE